MKDQKVFGPLLEVLNVSPMWNWHSPPVLWAVISEKKPVVVTPAFMLEGGLASLVALAREWREQMPEGNVPVDTLALTIEGTTVDGEVRDCIVVHKDGGMKLFRHYRGSDHVHEFDPTEVTDEPVEAMREVGASAWRD